MPITHPACAFLIGLPVSRVSRGYLSSVSLELGRLTAEKQGEVTLRLPSCEWHVLSAGNRVLSWLDLPPELDTALPRLVGRRICAVQTYPHRECSRIVLSGDAVIEVVHKEVGETWYAVGCGRQVIVMEGCFVKVKEYP